MQHDFHTTYNARVYNTTGGSSGAIINYVPDHMSYSLILCRIRVAQSLVFCVVFCRSMFVLLSFGHFYIICPSNYGFWLLLWCLLSYINIILFLKKIRRYRVPLSYLCGIRKTFILWRNKNSWISIFVDGWQKQSLIPNLQNLFGFWFLVGWFYCVYCQ